MMNVFLCLLCLPYSSGYVVRPHSRIVSIASPTALREPQYNPEKLSQNEIPNRVWDTHTHNSPNQYAQPTTAMLFAITAAFVVSTFTMGSAAYAAEIFESHDRITDGLPPLGLSGEDGALEVIQSAVTKLINVDQPAVQYGFDHYSRYFLAGGICASFSHGVAIPFDVVKTRLQTGIATEFASSNVLVVAQSIVDKEGLGMLFKGTGPTLIGYLIQGSLKYGFYEVFKPIVKAQMALAGAGVDSDLGNKVLGFMLAGACAEFIGSSFLAPFEAARIRLVANPSFAPGIVGCLNRMVEEETATSLFLGLPAILSKMIPYTVVQLSTYEVLTSSAYGYLAASGVDIANMGASRYLLSSACALAAGDLTLPYHSDTPCHAIYPRIDSTYTDHRHRHRHRQRFFHLSPVNPVTLSYPPPTRTPKPLHPLLQELELVASRV